MQVLLLTCVRHYLMVIISRLSVTTFLQAYQLIMELKTRSIFYVVTVRVSRLKQCPLLIEKDLKKKCRGAFDYHSNIILVRCCDNKPVNLVSSFVGIEPIHSVARYDRSQHKKVQFTQPNIVHVHFTSQVSEQDGGTFKFGCIASLLLR